MRRLLSIFSSFVVLGFLAPTIAGAQAPHCIATSPDASVVAVACRARNHRDGTPRPDRLAISRNGGVSWSFRSLEGEGFAAAELDHNLFVLRARTLGGEPTMDVVHTSGAFESRRVPLATASDLIAVSGRLVIAGIETGTQDRAVLLETSDGGRHWSQLAVLGEGIERVDEIHAVGSSIIAYQRLGMSCVGEVALRRWSVNASGTVRSAYVHNEIACNTSPTGRPCPLVDTAGIAAHGLVYAVSGRRVRELRPVGRLRPLSIRAGYPDAGPAVAHNGHMSIVFAAARLYWADAPSRPILLSGRGPIRSDDVVSMHVDSRGRPWIFTAEGHLYRFSRRTRWSRLY